MAYQRGVLTACAAEATDYIGDEDYEVARWFKVRLCLKLSCFSSHAPPIVALASGEHEDIGRPASI